MKDAHLKTMQRWFKRLNGKLEKIETSLATKEDTDRLYGLIERVHRRIDEHLSDDDKDKRIFKLAFERLEQKVEFLQTQL